MEARFVEVIFSKEIFKTTGLPSEDGDTVLVHLNTEFQALNSFPTASLVAVRFTNDNHGFVYNRTTAGQNFRACDIASVHAQHDGTCPASCNFLLEGLEDAVDSIEVGGSAIDLPNDPYAVTAAGAAALQADLREWLLSNHPAGFPQPYVTVTWNDLATDTLDISITASRLDFETVNTSEDFVNSCDPEE